MSRNRVWPGRIVISLVMALYVAGVVVLAGLGSVYRLRSEHDQRQMAALLRLAPSLPGDTEIVLLPVDLDERPVSYATGRQSRLDQYLEGAFERAWSAGNIARLAYKRPDIEAITTSHWDGPFRVTGVRKGVGGGVEEIVVNGRAAPINRLLAFTYAVDAAVLLSPLVLTEESGAEIRAPLPMVERVRTSSSPVREFRLTLEPVAGTGR